MTYKISLSLVSRLTEGSSKERYVNYQVWLYDTSFVIKDAILEHFPSVDEPSHVIIWHKDGIYILNYATIECIRELKE